jgi:hypothetical protein
MAENEQARQQEAARQAQQAAVAGTAALCKYCGAALDPDFSFCSGCGEKPGGEERECLYCTTRTTKELCPRCGRRVVPLICPQCGTPSINDACENCGAILSPALESVIAREAPEPAKMSAEETAKIEAEFKALEQKESPEFRAFQKKLIERQILLEEREYFNRREKRIIKAFGNRPFTLELPDPEEEAFRMKAYAGLEKNVIARAQEAMEAELEKLFPPLPPPAKIDDAELQRRRAEAESERQRWMGIERQKLQEEQFKKRILGTYVYNGGDRYDGISYLTIDTLSSAKELLCYDDGCKCYSIHNVFFQGTNVKLITTQLDEKGNCPVHSGRCVQLDGTINNNGTILHGYWAGNSAGISIAYYKQ